MKSRLLQHESQKPWWGDVVRVDYSTFHNSYELSVYEPFLIYKIKPKYNTEYKDLVDVSFNLPIPEFRVYSYPNAKNVSVTEIDEIYYNGIKKGIVIFRNCMVGFKDIGELSMRFETMTEIENLIKMKQYEKLDKIILL